MYARLLALLLLIGTLLVTAGCSSVEISGTDLNDTVTSVDGASINAEVSFSPNNPEPTTTITFNVPYGSWARLEVLNATGYRVALLVDEEEVESGYVSVPWDGTNDDGEKIKSGIYFYRLEWAQGAVMKAVVVCWTREECEDLIHDIE